MRPFYLFSGMIIGAIFGAAMPTVRPGPTAAETAIVFAIGGALAGILLGAFLEIITPMTRDHAHSPDPNVNAHRIVAESTGEDTPLPADLEAAWAAWSAGIQKVDERGMTLLRAAFEAGWDAGGGGQA